MAKTERLTNNKIFRIDKNKSIKEELEGTNAESDILRTIKNPSDGHPFKNTKNEYHIKYPLFLLKNLRYLDLDDDSTKSGFVNQVIKYFYQDVLQEKKNERIELIRKAAIEQSKIWKHDAIGSLREAYAEFVRQWMINGKNNKSEDENIMNKILPIFPSEDTLFYEFVMIFYDSNLFNDYNKYPNSNVSEDNWYESLFDIKENIENKSDLHFYKDDKYLGHKLKILNVRYFDHRSFYKVNREHSVYNRYVVWRDDYMRLNNADDSNNQIHELIADFIVKNKYEITKSTRNSSFLVGKFQSAIKNVYNMPILAITWTLLVYKIICVVAYITGRNNNNGPYNIEKKILGFVKKDESIWAEDIWCIKYLFDGGDKIILGNELFNKNEYNTPIPNCIENNIWCKDFKKTEDNDENMIEMYESLTLQKIHRSVCISSSSLFLNSFIKNVLEMNNNKNTGYETLNKLKPFGIKLLLCFICLLIIAVSVVSLSFVFLIVYKNKKLYDDEGVEYTIFATVVCFFIILLPLIQFKRYGTYRMISNYIRMNYDKWKYKWMKENNVCMREGQDKNSIYSSRYDCESGDNSDHWKTLPGILDFGKVDEENCISWGSALWYRIQKLGIIVFVKLPVYLIFVAAVLFYLVIVKPLKDILLYIYVFFYTESHHVNKTLEKSLNFMVTLLIIIFCIILLTRVLKHNNADNIVNNKATEDNENSVKLWENYLVSNYPEQKTHIDLHRFAALFTWFRSYEKNKKDDSGKLELGPFLYLFFVLMFYGLLFLVKNVKKLPLFTGSPNEGDDAPYISDEDDEHWLWKAFKSVIKYGGVFIIFILILSIWAVEYYTVYMKMKSEIDKKVAIQMEKQKDKIL